jgi:hypothetical protein
MHLRAYGDADGSWITLCQVAALFPPVDRRDRDRDGDVDRKFVVPSSEDKGYWAWLMRVACREEDEATAQRRRLEIARDLQALQGRQSPESSPKRLALIEACIDHLTWVEGDPGTWQSPIEEEWQAERELRLKGLPGPRTLGECGREYFLRRASALYDWAVPLEGGVHRRPWDDMKGYRCLRAQAYEALAVRDEEEKTASPGIPHRIGHQLAVRDSLLVTKRRRAIIEQE